MNSIDRGCALATTAFACLMLMSTDLAANAGGITGRTNRDGGAGCGDCHSPQAQSASMSVSISGPTTLQPGALGNYTITATLPGVANTRMGLNVAASAGTLSESSGNLRIQGGELTHTGTLATTNASGTASYSFAYTNPSNAAGGSTQTIYAVARIGMSGGWRHAANFTVTTPAPQQFSLTVSKTGTGTGTVASSPAGINCGTDCSENYNSGTSVTLTATPSAGSTFSSWSGACTGTGTCMVSMTAARSVTATFTLGAPADGSVTFQGLWWNSPAGSENGWGVNITHQGDTLFATWFTYDTDGSGLWLVMDNGARQPNGSFTGALYRTTGNAFSSTPFNPSTVTVTQVGTGTLTFSSATNGTFAYTVNGITQTKQITRQVFSAPVPNCTPGGTAGAVPNYQDLWWRSPAGSESGWGINLTHQGNTIFATWFTYGTDGRGMWLVMDNAARTSGETFTGPLYRTRGNAFNSTPWNASTITVTQVGTGTLTFTDANNGTFMYTVDGTTQTKPITRQVYSSPVSVCKNP